MLIETELQELRYIGWKFSWCNNQQDHLIYSKIDKCFGNTKWHLQFGQCVIEVQNFGCSDHSPLVLISDSRRMGFRKQFKFLNCMTNHPSFFAKVREGWSVPVQGVKMFQVWVS